MASLNAHLSSSNSSIEQDNTKDMGYPKILLIGIAFKALAFFLVACLGESPALDRSDFSGRKEFSTIESRGIR